jgi:hypothetical protein
VRACVRGGAGRQAQPPFFLVGPLPLISPHMAGRTFQGAQRQKDKAQSAEAGPPGRQIDSSRPYSETPIETDRTRSAALWPLVRPGDVRSVSCAKGILREIGESGE